VGKALIGFQLMREGAPDPNMGVGAFLPEGDNLAHGFNYAGKHAAKYVLNHTYKIFGL
jgi:hypothetical protein